MFDQTNQADMPRYKAYCLQANKYQPGKILSMWNA